MVMLMMCGADDARNAAAVPGESSLRRRR